MSGPLHESDSRRVASQLVGREHEGYAFDVATDARSIHALVSAEPESLSVVLKKGRKHHVLLIEGTIQTNVPALSFVPEPEVPLDPRWLHADVVVNGFHALPGPVAVDCGGSGRVPTPGSCQLTGHWWLDLDIDDASDRRFIGQPLCVEMQIRDISPEPVPGVTPATVSLHARLVRKS